MRNTRIIPVLCYVLLSIGCAGTKERNIDRFADMHIHFNWNQKEIISSQEVVDLLKRNKVVLALVSSTPPELALELANIGSGWIIPFFRPYYTSNNRNNWFVQKTLLIKTKEALDSGLYYGIGEIHLIGGHSPSIKNKSLEGLFLLAQKYQVPILIHTEASSADFFIPICQQYAEVKILWAHAGGLLSALQAAKVMESCPNVWVDLSARDNDRYINSPIVDHKGRLSKEWSLFVIRYQDRILIGTDPVWPVDQLEIWDRPGLGWSKFEHYLSFHRKWLSTFPQELANKIRLENAKSLFRIP